MSKKRNEAIEKFLVDAFATEVLQEIVIVLLGEIAKRTNNKIDDQIYEIVVRARENERYVN